MRKVLLTATMLTCCVAAVQGRNLFRYPNQLSPAAWTAEQARSADDFQESIGVNTHVSYTNTSYFKLFPSMLSKLEEAKIHHVRDGYFYRTATDAGASSRIFLDHRMYAQKKIGVLYSVGTTNNGGTTQPLMEGYFTAAGDAEGVEGGNECDVNRCTEQAIALYPTFKAVAKDLHLYVLAPSMTSLQGARAAGDLSAYIDYTNIHVYYGGRNPFYGWGDPLGNSHGNSYASTRWWLDVVQENNGKNKRTMVTETGYSSVPSVARSSPNYTLIDSIAASYIPRTLLNNFNAGVIRTFLYEFIDEGETGVEQTYGLLRSDLTEKPAYAAIKRLSLLTSDPGPSFKPEKLFYKVQGNTDNVFHTLLQKRDGTFLLIYWQEVSSWDPKLMTVKRVVIKPISVTLAGAHHFVSLTTFDATGRTTIKPMMGSITTDLPISDQLSVLAIK